MIGRVPRLGLTGGIGSGKSTVAGLLAARGAAVIDADAIARSLTAPGGAALPAIAAHFGPQAIGADGALDRDHMRQLVFADPSARQQLEAITHPLIGQHTQQQAQEAETRGAPLLVFDVPLLVESGRWRQQVDQVLVVDCTEATQISRVMARNGLAREAVERILAAQASRAQRRAAADWVIYNESVDLATLQGKVLSISAKFGL